MTRIKLCSVRRCRDKHCCRGYCIRHYRKWLKYGDALAGKSFERHGLSSSAEYRIWHGMIQRCTNPNSPAYSDYGGRGIKVCGRWLNSFQRFLSDMGSRPTPRHSINRIDNDNGYRPGNCKWSTRREQAINRRTGLRNTSGYRGVSWSLTNKKWIASIKAIDRRVHLGSFDDPAEAAWIYDEFAIVMFGAQAYVNFLR